MSSKKVCPVMSTPMLMNLTGLESGPKEVSLYKVYCLEKDCIAYRPVGAGYGCTITRERL